MLAVLANYGLRFIKWQYYLRVQGVRLSLHESLVIFVSAFSMAITPGKVGELLKAQLVKQRAGIPRRRTVPIVLAERITTRGVLWIAILLPLALLVVLMNRRLCHAVIGWSGRLPLVGSHTAKIAESYDAMGPLITPGRLLCMTLLSVLSWGGECMAYYLVWDGLGAQMGPWQAAFVYAFSTIAGVVTPGGLGPTEGFLILLPQALSNLVDKSQAVSAMGLIRAATLWFAVVLGLVCLFYFARRYRIDEQELEQAE